MHRYGNVSYSGYNKNYGDVFKKSKLSWSFSALLKYKCCFLFQYTITTTTIYIYFLIRTHKLSKDSWIIERCRIGREGKTRYKLHIYHRIPHILTKAWNANWKLPITISPFLLKIWIKFYSSTSEAFCIFFWNCILWL